MRTIIAGSREVNSPTLAYCFVVKAIHQAGWTPTTIISGGARGIDRAGELYANTHSIPLEVFPADWDKYGKSAGYLRNAQMADKAEALIAVWDGHSQGTANMIELAKEKGLRVHVYRLG